IARGIEHVVLVIAGEHQLATPGEAVAALDPLPGMGRFDVGAREFGRANARANAQAAGSIDGHADFLGRGPDVDSEIGDGFGERDGAIPEGYSSCRAISFTSGP